ncbi:AAA family ATPase [Pseudomonas benzenivorans]|uniref:AAA family ATPase n=1 Tax=Pseudomonas benzenivorans TaxID=556533 RepID=A0ABZ0PXP1_9PSED|nr:AAA family ATPase [Pseudomonas benzenivorans]WPC05957.1 AAA family ATPase [Pseudomonas benzenivorans]
MSTIKNLIDKISPILKYKIGYYHPSLYIICIDDAFKGKGREEKLEYIQEKCGVTTQEILRLEAATLACVEAIHEGELSEYQFALDKNSVPMHWLELFASTKTRRRKPLAQSIHFYGYKGGQARTSVLTSLAKNLANDGYRVLVVDADIEAPSISQIFSVSASTPERTLMGLYGWTGETVPLTAYSGRNPEGRIDILPTRPDIPLYDLDYAAFTLKSTIDTASNSKAAERLLKLLEEKTLDHDIVIFDHRTGLSSAIVPITQAWPGPVIVSIRNDDLSMQASSYISKLFETNPGNPGAFVSFSFSPSEQDTTREAKSQDFFLDILGAQLEKDNEEEEVIDISVLTRYWISWTFDPAYLGTTCPDFEKLSQKNQDAIYQLREILGLESSAPKPIRDRSAEHLNVFSESLHESGAKSSLPFIETPHIARLFQANNGINYVLGRKGTGKTRIFKEMVEVGLADPLFSAADSNSRGLTSHSAETIELIRSCGENYQDFWWTVLNKGLINTLGITDAVSGSAKQTIDLCSRLQGRKTFLIDGVETVVGSSKLSECTEALLRMLSTVQNDPEISQKISVILFIRSDLVSSAFQNIEQQTHNRKIEVKWDRESIFNFVLIGISHLNWFREKFEAPCAEIDRLRPELTRGQVGLDKCLEILLQIFPSQLRRSNIRTLTFFNTYFSDAGVETNSKASFYPRLYIKFLNNICTSARERSAEALDSDRKVSQSLLFEAHEVAAKEFMGEVTQELSYSLNLSGNQTDNTERVTNLVAALEELSTPFSFESICKTIYERLNKSVNIENIKTSMRKMKDMGIFEERLGFPGQWRAGGLYKYALRMKYVRKLKQD